MQIPIYQIDAFTSRLFAGNPAAVCVLDEWLPDALLQSIAAENNLAETAFFLRRKAGERIPLRWFTPNIEMDLCGHATLASAWVWFERLEPGQTSVTFTSQSGPLTVTKEGPRLALDFPARPPEPVEPSAELVACLGGRPIAFFKSRDYLVLFESEADVRALDPDLFHMARVEDTLGVICTAPGSAPVDFVSRFFAPAAGVPEDPVTGSAHCTLIPFWANRLGRTALLAHQVSARGGVLHCELRGDRVRMAGETALYLEGVITCP